MKKFIYVLLVTVLVGAQAALAEVKVAVIDVQAAILGSEYAKERIAELKKEYAPDQKEIKDLGVEIQKLQVKIEQDAAVMSESEKKNIAKKIEGMAVDYQFLAQKLQKAQSTSQQELMAELSPKLQQAIETIIEQGTYTVILERKSAIYVSPEYDITRKVTEQLNLAK